MVLHRLIKSRFLNSVGGWIIVLDIDGFEEGAQR